MADYENYQGSPPQPIAAASLAHGAGNKKFSPNSQEYMSQNQTANLLQAAFSGIVIELIRDDIFSYQDPFMHYALVNPANSKLEHGGGLAGKICKAAHPGF